MKLVALLQLVAVLFVFSTVPGCKEKMNKEDEPARLKVDSVYTWICNMQQDNGLLLTNEDGKYVSLYDNALAALLFTAYGDFERAEHIFDFFDNRIDAELLSGKGGFGQLRTANGIPAENRPRRWMGDNAWLLISLNYYLAETNSAKYAKLAKELSSWIMSLQDTDGGLWGGFETNGNRIPKITEGNIDAFNAITGYGTFHQKILAFLKNSRWDKSTKLLRASTENTRYQYALDLHSWGYCIFENFPAETLTKADRFLTTQKSTITGENINGYCFDEDKDAVWLEGTGQMAVAFIKAGNETEARKYLAEMDKCLVKSKKFSNAYALPYTVNFGTSFGYESLWTNADTSPAVSSTGWYLFGLLRFNPLQPGFVKNIPQPDKFWLE